MTSTQEIEKAVSKLEVKSLKGALKAFNASATGDKDELCERYQKKVLEVGVRNFIKKLKTTDVKAAAKSMSIKVPSDIDEARSSLEEKVTDSGIAGLITTVDDNMLRKFCSTLGLEPTDREDMIKQIADEVMLTGMESFLNELSVPLLKSHCTELELSGTGSKSDLVERLMVSIFELEPLQGEEDKSGRSKKNTQKKGASSTSPSTSSSPKKKASGGSSSKKAKKESSKRIPWVSPPLETIKKGKYDTFTALYDNFNLPDLVKFCKQKNIPCSGKKKLVINRILQFLKNGVVEEPKKKGKKRKATSSGKKGATKKQKTSATSNSTQEKSGTA